jgi:3-hydroxymyristoyl/3-hydroxydecanoyl-(acyl carrier protein) dehydratase
MSDVNSSVIVEVPAGHPAFAGHFPGHPVLPGVVLLDEVVAAAESHLARPLEALQVRVAKFHAPVAPGARLCIELTGRDPVRFSVTCDEVRVATGELAPADGDAGRTTP